MPELSAKGGATPKAKTAKAKTPKAKTAKVTTPNMTPKIMTGELAPARHVPRAATRSSDQDHIRHMMQRR
jgi:hypothetical protein